MSEDLDKKWADAFEHPGKKIPVGDVVCCDLCNRDYTEKADVGGFLFGSKGVCPACAPKFEESIKRYGEEEFIKGRCPEGQSFADWIREIRGPDAFIRVTTGGNP